MDPIFKKRFGIETSIRYIPMVEVEPKWLKSYESAWKRRKKKIRHSTSKTLRKRFDGLLKRVERLGDDLPYCNRIEIRFINREMGFGVFAKENIPPYALLNCYAGIMKPDRLIKASNHSTFAFYQFKPFSIDAEKAGNWCRFMNHASEKNPKTNVVAWEHYSKWGPRIFFTASHRGIKKGDQLLYSYGEFYWKEREFLEI